MSEKENCWEFMKCGRERRGEHALEFGVCPAYTERKLDGVHGGENAGRACWAVAGTYCAGKVQGTFAEKETTCLDCDFHKKIRHEEFENYMMAKELLKMIS